MYNNKTCDKNAIGLSPKPYNMFNLMEILALILMTL